MYRINLQLTIDHISSINNKGQYLKKLGSGGLRFLCSTLPLIKVYLPIKIHVKQLISFVVTEICSTQDSSMKNNKGQ